MKGQLEKLYALATAWNPGGFASYGGRSLKKLLIRKRAAPSGSPFLLEI